MSAMRGLLVLGLVVVVTAAAYLLWSGDSTDRPVAVDRASAAEGGTEKADAPAVATEGPALDEAAPTRSEARAEAVEADAAAASSDAAASEGVRVHGRVVDEGGRPVAGANVRLRPSGIAGFHHDDAVEESLRGLGAGTVTDTDGRFSFSGVKKPAARELFVRAAAFVDETRDLPERSRDVDLGDVVVALGGTLVGHVVDDAGNPVPNAEVRAWTRDGSKSAGALIVLGDLGGANARKATTDGSGAFRIDGLKPGDVTALASAEGYSPQSVKGLIVKTGEVTADVRIPVSVGFGIQGVVVDAQGRALEGADVWYSETVIDLTEGAVTGSMSQGRRETTDAAGRFRLSGLREGTYNLTARKPGHLARAADAVETGTTDVRIALPESGVLWGHVRSARDGAPIPSFEISPRSTMRLDLGAFVVGGDREVLRGEAAAAAAGVEPAPSLYAVASLDSEEVELTASADGFARFGRGGIDVPAGQRVRFDVELVPEVVVSGVVLAADGAPAANASVAVAKRSPGALDLGGRMRFSRRVEVRNDGGDPEIIDEGADQRTTTDNEGRFEVRGLAPGDYSVVASHREWAPSEAVPISLDDVSVEGMEVVLRAGGRLVGTAYDADGQLLAGGTVRLTKSASGGVPGGGPMRIGGRIPGLQGASGGENLSARTGEDGRYELTGILPGRYRAELSAPSKGPMSGGMIMLPGMDGEPKGTPVTIEEGETATLDLALPPTGSVRGRVSEAGNPLAGVAVSLSKTGAMIPGFGGPSARTDDEGRFELADLEPGEYELSVSPKGAARPITRSVDVDARRVTEEDVVLPTGVISGRVTDVDSGRGLEGVVLEVVPADRDDDEAEAPPVRRAAFVTISQVEGGGGGVQSYTFGNEDQSVRTGGDGRYEVRFLEPGDYRVEIRGGGVEPQSKDRVRVHPSGRTDGVDFEATLGATLVVRALTADDEPIRFLRATLTHEASGNQESQMEVGSPKITFEGLAPGTYALEVRAGDRQGERALTIASGEEKEVTVDLE